jgi:hypothetical protein
MKPWVFTDDPEDPCALCVAWDEGDDPFGEEARPYLPSGYVDRIYRFTHRECTAAAIAYTSEAAMERLGLA